MTARATPFHVLALALAVVRGLLVVGGTVVVCCTVATGCAPTWVAERAASLEERLGEPAPNLSSTQGDPAPEGPSLTVRSAVDDVLTRNVDLQSMRHAVRGMLAMARESAGLPEPMLEFGTAPLAIGTGRGLMVGYSHPIPWTSGLEARARAALSDAEAMTYDREAMRRMLAAMAGQAVVDIAAGQAMQAVLTRHNALMDVMGRAAIGRVSAGRGDARDALRAETEKARADRDRLGAARMVRTSIAALRALAHRSPAETTLTNVDVEAIFGQPAPLEPLEALLASAGRDRPEVLASQARVAARAADIDAATIMNRPMMAVGVQVSTMADDPMMWPTLTFSIGLPTATDSRKAMIDRAEAGRDEAQAVADSQRDTIAREVAERHADLVEVLAALDVTEHRLLPVASKSLELAAAAYRGGSMANSTMGIDSVLLAAQAVLEAEMSRIDLRKRYAMGLVMLDLAVGRMPGARATGTVTP